MLRVPWRRRNSPARWFEKRGAAGRESTRLLTIERSPRCSPSRTGHFGSGLYKRRGGRVRGLGPSYSCSISSKPLRLDPSLCTSHHGYGLPCHPPPLLSPWPRCVRAASASLPPQRFPPDGRCYRGGALPRAHHAFFKKGMRYRIPGFLATSFSRRTAVEFAARAHEGGGEPVLWTVCTEVRGLQGRLNAAKEGSGFCGCSLSLARGTESTVHRRLFRPPQRWL